MKAQTETNGQAVDPHLINDQELIARIPSLTKRNLADMRRRRLIPFVKISPKVILYSWPHVVDALARLEVKSVGDKK